MKSNDQLFRKHVRYGVPHVAGFQIIFKEHQVSVTVYVENPSLEKFTFSDVYIC